MKFFEKKIVRVSFFFRIDDLSTKAAKIGSEKKEDEPSGTRARDGFKASTKERKEKRTTHLINSRKKISLFE